MADSYRDIAQTLRDRANLRFEAHQTPYDVLYTEQETVDRTTAISRFPQVAAGSAQKPHIPAKCIPGAVHPKCDWLILVDAYRTGGDDHHDNWTLLYRPDLAAYITAYNLAHAGTPLAPFPDILAKDKTTRANERNGGGGEELVIQWQFDVVNPQNYTAPTLYVSTHPIETSLVLISEKETRNGPIATIDRTYAKLPTTELTTAEYKNEDVLPPAKFLPSITLTTAERIATTATPPDTGATVLESRVEAIDPARRKKTTTTGAYPSISVLVGSDVDMETGLSYPVTEEVVVAGTQGSGVNGGGFYSTVDAINPSWSIKTTRKAITTPSRSWTEIINYPWPAVLDSISINIVTQSGLPIRAIVRPNWRRYAYAGPCGAVITERWSMTPPTPPNILSLVTTPIVYDGVFFQVSVPNCLHPTVVFTETSGTNNPSYDYFTHTETVAQTTFTDWPSSIYGPYSVTPYRGWYLSRETVVFSPA